MDHRPSTELLESSHSFPGVYQIKAIGSAEGDFPARVIDAVAEELASPGEIDYSTRETMGGRHISVTMNITVQNAEQVRAIYTRIREVAGLVFVL